MNLAGTTETVTNLNDLQCAYFSLECVREGTRKKNRSHDEYMCSQLLNMLIEYDDSGICDNVTHHEYGSE